MRIKLCRSTFTMYKLQDARCGHMTGTRASGAWVDASVVSWCWMILIDSALRSILIGSALSLIWMVLIGSALRFSQ